MTQEEAEKYCTSGLNRFFISEYVPTRNETDRRAKIEQGLNRFFISEYVPTAKLFSG